MPSINSFRCNQYFATHNNAFWHIVGDALGHRRKAPEGGWRTKSGTSTKIPSFIEDHLLYKEGPYLTYEEQLSALMEAGFALWDVLRSCEREGSTDSKIRMKSVAGNDIKGFCDENPSIRRICFASGSSTATYFRKFNEGWLKRNQFSFAKNEATQKVFKKFATSRKRKREGAPLANDTENGREESERNCGKIELVVMQSVSPAFTRPWKNTPETPKASSMIYTDKRAFWFQHAFGIESPSGEQRHYIR
mmetsp:Transcript_5496/g.7315  ORF Transcript_5496/g.7315 Transcript_5496/m.7315 type:complete len:249 (-) Transcript_5496:75-821(-)|eukprot:CAMPEP_0185266220 /NCGR_PEP_ID=MMETSP1359-20130426/30325_1 /TAXON_ID=552665 /ORGANISM="Bigelowiella longifila, Strain CCMP242" /LENGTH=248 /DNA_ID=CAMNT_0027855923 /DNA_START=130 /DNA_END=876 /DNA_ORIENTATION=+